MSLAFVLLWMFFFHIVDDFYLQGLLISLKQKSWWEENAPSKVYEKDYYVALIMHGFSWAFMTMLPVAFYLHFNIDWGFVFILAFHALLHATIDNEKANEKSINLIIDQVSHLFQILTMWLYLLVEAGVFLQ